MAVFGNESEVKLERVSPSTTTSKDSARETGSPHWTQNGKVSENEQYDSSKRLSSGSTRQAAAIDQMEYSGGTGLHEIRSRHGGYHIITYALVGS
jgi:hypothetical protein